MSWHQPAQRQAAGPANVGSRPWKRVGDPVLFVGGMFPVLWRPIAPFAAMPVFFRS